MSSVFPLAHFDLNAHTLFAITTALAILPTVCLRNLSLLSYLSAGGVMATIAVIVFLFWVGSCSEALILPCACYLSIKKGAVPLWEIILCIVIIMIGAVCACVGSYTSVSQMISSTR
ncbi:Transmembrane amino acid transporter family protein [Zea mays]|uniref:Transmembrane amino acid transporter family protein n=1 Tax=Zea mays TaxID=4577 RepID=A0A1D6KQ04_MAIZE|nr:Transmembrane amino acid transporter family protein [Zea mays]